MQNKQVGLASILGAGILMLGVPAVVMTQQTAIAQQAGQITVGNLIAALNNIAVQIDNLEALTNLTVKDVQVVNVEDVLKKNNFQVLDNALNRNNVEIFNLRNVLNDNEIIKEALSNNNVAVNDVVAINVLSGGDVIVFTQN